MPQSSIIDNDFINQITAIVEKNIANEQFGVSELAEEMNMSRSNLLRKIKKLTNLSVSQLIREVRLQRGMDLLRQTTLNVSEVAFQVGFSSTSYFIKCFREYYGYPPGEVGKRAEEAEDDELVKTEEVAESSPVPVVKSKPRSKYGFIALAGLVLIIALGLWYFFKISSSPVPLREKSIVVLPFKNDSSDSSNVYIINGLMESTLNNLQKIKDLKVISRTSAEKYRHTTKTIPEMAQELHANYFVEGSGQKIGNQILLNIQLIDATTDQHLWAKQYKRETQDIFTLQQEIARNIAQEIQAVITPEEEKRINKNPTNNLVAYDLFLKGQEFYRRGRPEDLAKAIPFLKKAVAHDSSFALAYAELATVYYYRDLHHTEKKFTAEVNNYADKALLYDAKLPESLVAKAMYYMLRKEYSQSVPYLEKALEYHPNSALVIHFLSDLYNLYLPNAAKYLEYALKGLRLDVASYDSATTSYTYLHLSNAFVQTGFIDEALRYINKSLQYNPHNPFAGYLKVFILYAKTHNLPQTRQLMLQELNKDTTRLDIMLQMGQICYQMRDYKSAYQYYKRFTQIREQQKLEVYQNQDLNIGITLAKMGYSAEAEKYIRSYKKFADQDKSIYQHLYLATYYAYRNNVPKALEHFELFSRENNYQYWVLLSDKDPVADTVKNLPEFKKTMANIKAKFWQKHRELKKSLEAQQLL
ncbi:helix-turn-helix domain-containing protein [Adhaeribacter swui]|uniref:Helix-turn-helix domain-containing protein n=1 Tax=Adhaeribacter swui TaxID=2086471 RepID=A0A7G7G633_9BACT|nr:helix-turn-helix domain-containing protein [Adhaeribacter swui]QNF32617.1 helix-turn-helix domain-containing protein [Adhaeribacter swui]